MRLFASFSAVAVVTLPLAIAAPNKSYKPGNMDASYYKTENVINVDVVIIGGGGMSAHSAIQLNDQGKKIVVVESKARLEATLRPTWTLRPAFLSIWVWSCNM
jgi:NADPH-dependent 2,4-dienoyl-CoA reductase/sulfur reductase-like enzyme